jgi:hypothetical protein
MQVVVPLPDEAGRKDILGVHLRNVPMDSMDEKAEACDRMARVTSGAHSTHAAVWNCKIMQIIEWLARGSYSRGSCSNLCQFQVCRECGAVTSTGMLVVMLQGFLVLSLPTWSMRRRFWLPARTRMW